VIAKAAAGVGGQQPSYQRLLAAEALLRRQGSAGPVELPGGVSAYRLSLAQREGSPAVDSAEGDSAEVDRAGGDSAVPDSTAGADKPTPVHRGGARCGKLVFRPQKPPAK